MAACANSYAVCRHPSAQSCPFSHQACIDRQDEPYCKLTVLPCPTDHCYSGVGAYAGVHFRIIPYMQPLIGTNKRRTHSHKHTVDVWAKRDTKVLSHFSVVTVYLPTVRPAVGIGKATIDCCWLVPKLEHTHTQPTHHSPLATRAAWTKGHDISHLGHPTLLSADVLLFFLLSKVSKGSFWCRPVRVFLLSFNIFLPRRLPRQVHLE